jgi:hypothetical protein
MSPGRLAASGAVLLFITIVLAFDLRTGHKPKPPQPPRVPVTTTTRTPKPKPKPPPATTTTPTPPPAPPPTVAMSWNHAGAFVWHTHDVDPDWLGQQMRSAGFGWVAIYMGSAGDALPSDPEWVYRFERSSGLPVGGWSSLRGNAHADAGFAAKELKLEGLSFYIADAEAEYQGKPGLSQKFVTRFRELEPRMTAGLSSLCNAQGIGLAPWARAGFAFLPQAYTNDFGPNVAPTACVRAAAAYFPLSRIHPTVGSYKGTLGWVEPQRYAQLLAQAKTTGFSVYLAETAMPAQNWQAYGSAITSLRIAVRVR